MSTKSLNFDAKSLTPVASSVEGQPAASLTPQELEAERAWWCEASERQVKELETSFGTAFQSTANKLRNDLSACQDRLERLLEAEKKQRNELMAELSESTNSRLDRLESFMEMDKGRKDTEVQDLKRNVNTQQLLLTELARQHQEMLGLEAKVEHRLQEALQHAPRGLGDPGADAPHDLYNKLRSDFDSFSLQYASKDANFKAEWAHQKVQVAALTRDLELLQSKSQGAQCSEAMTAMEAALVDVRRDLGELRRDVRGLQQQEQQPRPSLLAQGEAAELRRELARLTEEQRLSGPKLQQLQADLVKVQRELLTVQAGEQSGPKTAMLETTVLDIRREVANLQELQQQAATPPRVQVVEASVLDIRKELEALQERQKLAVQETGQKYEQILPVVEASVRDIRKDLNVLKESQGVKMQEVVPLVEASARDIRRELALLQEETSPKLQDLRKELALLQETQLLHQQHASDTGPRIQELRKEMSLLQESQLVHQKQVQEHGPKLQELKLELEGLQELQLQHRQQAQELGPKLSDLRKELALLHEAQQLHQQQTQETDPKLQTLQRELAVLREMQQLQQQQSQETDPRVLDLQREVVLLQGAVQRQAQEELIPLVETKVLDIRRDLSSLKQEQQQQAQEAGSKVEARVGQLQREVAALTELQDQQRRQALETAPRLQQQATALETAREDLRKLQDTISLREQQIEELRSAAASTAKTHEDARAFQDIVMQSTVDLGRGLEEISQTVVVSEEKLRKEMEALKGDVASKTFQAVLEQSCEKNAVELTALRAHLDVVFGQVADLKEAAPMAANRGDMDRLGQLLEADVRKVQGHVEAVEERMQAVETARGKVTEMEAAHKGLEEAMNRRMTEALVQERASMAVQMAELRQRVEAPSPGVQRSEMEELLGRRLSDALAQERAAVATQLANLWQLVEATNAAARHQPTISQPPTQELKASGFDQSASHAVEEIKSDLCVLQMAVQVLEKRYHEAPHPTIPDNTLSRIDHTEGELKRVMGTMVILSSRVDTCEQEVWKSLRDLPAITTRMDLVETDMKKLAREGGTLSADIGVLRMLMETWNQKDGMEAKRMGRLEGPRLSLPGSPQAPSRQISDNIVHRRQSGASSIPEDSEPPSRSFTPMGRNRLQGVDVHRPAAGARPEDPAADSSGVMTAVPTTSSTTTNNSAFNKAGSKSSPGPPEPPSTDGSSKSAGPRTRQLTADLQQNITNLVQRVNNTLSSKPAGVDANSSAQTVQQALKDLREKHPGLRPNSPSLVDRLTGDGSTTSRAVPQAKALTGSTSPTGTSPTGFRGTWPPRGSGGLPTTARAPLTKFNVDTSKLAPESKAGSMNVPGGGSMNVPGGSMNVPSGGGPSPVHSGSHTQRHIGHVVGTTPGLVSPMPQRGRDRIANPLERPPMAEPVAAAAPKAAAAVPSTRSGSPLRGLGNPRGHSPLRNPM